MHALTRGEVEQVGAGITWQQVSAGLGILALGISIAATGGMAGIAIGVIAGAGTAGEIGLAGLAQGLAGAGGATIGGGLAD